jgi:FAD/FMN-containing dehydrogenase
VGARIVLADGSVVDCDPDREPDLFWALRGAGGGQFGVVTSLIFDTVPEPITARIEAHWPDIDVEDLVATWQAWAPDAPDELTVNLTLSGTPVQAHLSGAATLDERTTRSMLRSFPPGIVVHGGLPFSLVKDSFAGPPSFPRIRSEFFSRALSGGTVASLLSEGLGSRQLTFTAMGGAYNRVAPDATAFAHRGSRFLLEHIGDPAWVSRSWAVAHPDGSGSVYPNFPDPALDDWAAAYHGGNFGRLVAVKKAYDRNRFFDFPQAV